MFNLFGTDVKKLDKENNIAELLKCLDSRSDGTRLEALKALARRIDEKGVEERLHCLINDKDSTVSSAAVLLFAARGDSSVRARMKDIVLNGGVKDKIEGLLVLSDHGKTDDMEILNMVIIASKDKNKLIRGKAIKTMGYIKSPNFVPHLAELLHDDNWKIRFESVKALGRIGGGMAVEPLISAIMDSNQDVVSIAKKALIGIGTPAAMKALQDEPFTKLMRGMTGTLAQREDTIKHIANQANREGLPLLLKACGDKYKEVRIEAVKALRVFEDVTTVAPILKLLDDKYFDVRVEAIYTLEKIHSPEAVEGIQKALQDKSSRVRTAASQAMEGLGKKRVN